MCTFYPQYSANLPFAKQNPPLDNLCVAIKNNNATLHHQTGKQKSGKGLKKKKL